MSTRPLENPQQPARTGEALTREQGTASNAITVPHITLPQGGGAIKGIDDTFKVNPSNGTASFSIPLPFSANRNAFTPQVALSYNSGTGNGLMGIGWDLNLPSIQRNTNKKIPRYRDANQVDQVGDEDSFLLSGAGELVPYLDYSLGQWTVRQRTEGDVIIRQYRPRQEGDFARIERLYQPATGYYWKVTTNGNITTFFGISEACRIADPIDDTRIVQWLPEFSYDDKGSWVWYDYKAEDLQGIVNDVHEKNRLNTVARFSQKHPKRIKYGNEQARYFDETPYLPPLPVAENYFFEVVFDYGEHGPNDQPTYEESRPWAARADAFSSYRAGFEMRTYRLCRRVLLFQRFAELGSTPTLVRATAFTYDFSTLYDSPAPLTQPTTELTYLTAVEQIGYVRTGNVYSQQSLPKMTFQYQKLRWDKTIQNVSRESLTHAPVGLSGNYQWTDLYSEGIRGILTEQANAWYYKANFGQVQHSSDALGELHFAPAQLVLPKPSFLGLNDGALQLLDLEANGQKQVVVQTDGLGGFFELCDDGHWQPFQVFLKNLSVDLKDPNIRFLDVNGDGKPEVVLADQGAFWWWENEGKLGYDSPELAAKPYDEERGAAVVFADAEQRIFLADMSGDGLTDIVRIRNGDVCYWANLGYGHFGTKVTMSNAPVFDRADSFNPAYLHLADISGTGATDLIYAGRDGFRAYLNCSGNRWTDAEEISPSFPAESPNRITVTDLLGNGTACVVWSSELPAYGPAPMRYIDLMGGLKPHIMKSHDNGLGKTTTIDYKSSTFFYLKDKLAGTPWITKLPFPVQVVCRITVTESVTRIRFTAQYSYHHGYYDHAEREFRGFGRVDQTDTDYFDNFAGATNATGQEHHQPPVLTKTWFHTGAFLGKDRILTQFKREYWPEEFRKKGYALVAAEYELLDANLTPAATLGDFSVDHLSTDEWQEALRACKGMVLRQEVFGLDAQKRIADEKAAKQYADQDPQFLAFQALARKTEELPYSVATHNCAIQLLQRRGQNRYASFLVNESESLTYGYERDPDDPRIAHTFHLETDELGNVRETVSVVYPRLRDEIALADDTTDSTALRKAKEAGRNAQKKRWITFTKVDVTNDVIAPSYQYLRKTWQTKTYELTGVVPVGSFYRIEDFRHRVAEFEEIAYEQKSTTGAQKRLVEHIKTKFYNEALTGPLAEGVMAPRALPFESYQLAYTPNLLSSLFTSSAYSMPFEVTDTDMLAGKFLQDNTNWWVQSGTIRYTRQGENQVDAQGRFFAPVGYIDPFDSETEVFYDTRNLFMRRAVAILDPVARTGNDTEVVRFNYRTLSPDLVKDLNDNLSAVIVDELGLVKASALEGKATSNAFQGDEGDNLVGIGEATSAAESALIQAFFAQAQVDAPQVCAYTALLALARQLLGNATSRLVYDFSRQPTVVASIVREQHTQQLLDSPLQISFEYTDGLGRVAMKKVQAEPGLVRLPDGTDLDTGNQLRWVSNGRTVLNNKGNPIKQYEPYFSTTPAYENDPFWVERGVSPTLYYDGSGRNIRTELPDGTFTKIVFDAWKQYHFDANDTSSESHWYKQRLGLPTNNPDYKVAKKTEVHADTPSLLVLDTLGRPVLGIDHNRWEDGSGVLQEAFYGTYSDLDIEGNARSITDARGNVVMSWQYDMLGHRVVQTSMDAGKRWMLNDSGGKPVKSWDERQHEFSFMYDVLHRPAKKLVQGGDGPVLLNHCYEWIIYGESRPDAKANNLRGQAAVLYDTAGKIVSERYDFKGNLLNSTRTFASDYKSTPNWNAPSPDALLATSAYTFTQRTEYDALNRPLRHTTPDGRTTQPSFNPAGLLEKVTLREGTTDTDYVRNIDYDAKGQRTRIDYGNDVATTYDYDPLTFRLNRLTTNGLADSNRLQDLVYTYDPIGNITQIQDNAVPVVFYNNQKITGRNEYTYDALYHLQVATGREQNANSPAFGSEDNWNDTYALFSHRNGDPMALRSYTQRYQYDGVGNLLQMRHEAGTTGSWTRDNTFETKNNRLKTSTVGNAPFGGAGAYPHHPRHGFLTAMPHLSSMTWTFKEELQSTAKQSVNGGIPEMTYYVYDGSGQRVRKITENQAQPGLVPTRKDERIYVGSYEVYRNGNGLARESLHITDDKSRIALIDTETEPRRILGIAMGRTTPFHTVRYQLSNHLGSVSLELDENADIISYEEYHPFGTTAYQARNADIQAAAKRYRYTGMERDEETGLNYHGARYYIPWLGRWVSCDPSGLSDGLNLYLYVHSNPVNKKDITGRGFTDWLKEKKERFDYNLTHGDYLGSSILQDDKKLQVAQAVAEGVAVGAVVTVLAIVAAPVLIAAAGSAATTAAGGTALALGASATTAGAVATTAGAVTTAVVEGGLVAYGVHQTVTTVHETVTGRDAETGRKLSDPERGYRVGTLVAGVLAVGYGLKGKASIPKTSSKPKVQTTPSPLDDFSHAEIDAFAENTDNFTSENLHKVEVHQPSPGEVTEVSIHELIKTQKTPGTNRLKVYREMLKGEVEFPPIDIVRTPEGLKTLDHTRIAALAEVGETNVKAIIHESGEALPESMQGRFGKATTWGQAAEYRIQQQRR